MRGLDKRPDSQSNLAAWPHERAPQRSVQTMRSERVGTGSSSAWGALRPRPIPDHRASDGKMLLESHP